jgi:hypothetical protein
MFDDLIGDLAHVSLLCWYRGIVVGPVFWANVLAERTSRRERSGHSGAYICAHKGDAVSLRNSQRESQQEGPPPLFVDRSRGDLNVRISVV